jgi:hypothetical protein
MEDEPNGKYPSMEDDLKGLKFNCLNSYTVCGGGLHTNCRVTPTSFLVEVGLLQLTLIEVIYNIFVT